MEVLIVAKTKMKKNRVCVGGIDIATNTLVRLLNPGGKSIPSSTNLNIGETWDIETTVREDITEPHIEDLIIGKKKLVTKAINISEYIDKNEIKVWIGGIKKLFDGKLGWTYTKGRGYISKSNIPINSVGFWRSDKDLILHEKGFYEYKGFLIKRGIPYKGIIEPIDTIPSGTLIRVSLARWWHPTNINMEDRCYLQLSGWYF